MFCEKCGTRVDDGQPFCPNCGNRLSASGASASPANPVNPGVETYAPVNPGFKPAQEKLPSFGSLLDRFNGVQGMEKIYYAGTFGLLIVCFIFAMLKSLTGGGFSAHMCLVSPFFYTVITILFTLCITFFLLDLFNKFTFKLLWIFIAAAAALILLIFIIIWIDSDAKLTAGGWLFLIFQCGLTAVSVLNLLEKQKTKGKISN